MKIRVHCLCGAALTLEARKDRAKAAEALFRSMHTGDECGLTDARTAARMRRKREEESMRAVLKEMDQ